MEWKNLKTDGYPKRLKPCVIETEHPNTYVLGCWNNNKWQINLYNNLPINYDDSGGVYHTEVIRYAYLPEDFFDKSYTICGSFHPNMYGDGIDHCFGTKEIDACSCKGNKNNCDFY